MNKKTHIFSLMLVLSLLFNVVALPFGSITPTLAAALPVVDDFEAGLPVGAEGAVAIGFGTFADPSSTAAISTTDAAPAPTVPGRSAGNHVLKLDLNVISWAGTTHFFENAALDTWVTQDWSAYAGFSFYLYGTGTNTDLFVDVLDNRKPGSTTDDAERWTLGFKDDFTGWQLIEIPFASMTRKDIGNGAPNDGFGLTEVTGWGFGTLGTGGAKTYYIDDISVYGTAPIRPLSVGFSAINYPVTEGAQATITAKLSKASAEVVTVDYKTTLGQAVADRDYTPVSGTMTFAAGITEVTFTVQTFDNQKYQGNRSVLIEMSNPSGELTLGIPPITQLTILDNEIIYPPLIDDFETYPYLWSANGLLSNPEIEADSPLALPGQGDFEHILQASPYRLISPLIRTTRLPGPAAPNIPVVPATYSFGRTFPTAQDWSAASGLSFWYYGENTNQPIKLELANNQAVQTDPTTWELVWGDEFNNHEGAAPNPFIWGQEVGDGTVNSIPGWGNNELEYYTGGTENAAADGLGNLKITAREADGSLMCYYGPCKYTSARLLTKDRFEIAYGRVEARIKVPTGAGIWPAFWMLGTNLDQVGWPQGGEIDIMEYVGRLPNEVFGTLHGPGYSGGASYGKVYDLGEPVADQFHTYSIEWQPDKIVWAFDGIPYFTATPQDAFLQGKEWVFNHPFYVVMNVAVGGNFAGAVDPDVAFPQSMYVDYVRLYQAPPEPVTSSVVIMDDFTGWKKITVPFTDFTSDGADDLDLAAVQSIKFSAQLLRLPPVRLDQIRLTYADATAPTVEITSDAAGGTANGPVTFTFAFSEDVGNSFIASDVVVSGGTAGTFTRVSGTEATLVVNPPAGTTGTLEVSVAAGTFFDTAFNLNTAPATAEQVFDTTSVSTNWETITFDDPAVTYGLEGFGGAQDSQVVIDPTDAANKVARVIKSGTAELWAGTIVYTGANFSVPVLPFTADNTRMTVRVWSPDAGIQVRLKVEDASDGTKSVETEATVTTAAGWQTLTFDFANEVTGAPLNLSNTYNKVVIFFNFGVTGATAGEKTYYFDNVDFVP